MKTITKNILITFVPLFCIILLMLGGCANSVDDILPTITPYPTAAAMAKTTYTVQRGDVLNQIAIPGRIVPVDQKDMFFYINGRVRQVYVQNGDDIDEGQILADLEGIDDIERVQSMNELALERVMIREKNAQLSLDLYKLLTPTYTTGYSETLQIHQNEVALAEIAVKEAMLSNLDLQMAISDTLLVAPMKGKITWLYLKEGREVQAYQSVGTVSDVENLEVGLDIEGEIQRGIEEGMEVLVSPRRGQGETVEGVVRWVYKGIPNASVGDDTIRITLEKSPQDAGYQLEQRVNINIILNRSDETLWLPPFAIRKFEGRTFVVVQDGELQRRVDIRLGVVGEDRVEILEGLEEGQVVVGQ